MYIGYIYWHSHSIICMWSCWVIWSCQRVALAVVRRRTRFARSWFRFSPKALEFLPLAVSTLVNLAVNANINPKASSCTFEMKYIRFSKHKKNLKKALLFLYIPHHTSTIYIKFRDFHIPNFIFTADSSKLVQRCWRMLGSVLLHDGFALHYNKPMRWQL